MTDGDEYSYGRLEVKYNNTWGTVCELGFTIVSANVVCRQLGFTRGAKAYYGGAQYGPGEGKIWLYNVRCNDIENNIAACPHSLWGQTPCTHAQDLSIECIKGKTYGSQYMVQFLLVI